MAQQCPICNGKSIAVSALKSNFLKSELEKYFNYTAPGIEILDYNLYRCQTCSLEFVDPPVPGNDAYYTWLSHRPGYYPESRWEWPIAIDLFQEHAASKNLSLVEIGCGSGAFLDRVRAMENINGFGIDTTQSAINVCLKKGLDAFCGTIDQYKAAEPNARFDGACSFHCLEHVSKPLEFMQKIKSIVSSNGLIIISTPYSPMTFENAWFDPMNHPPHHMTRWNKNSYTMLAQQLGMKLALVTSPATSIKSRMKEGLGFKKHGVGKVLTDNEMSTGLLKKPFAMLREYRYQKNRDVVNDAVAGNAVIAIFSAK